MLTEPRISACRVGGRNGSAGAGGQVDTVSGILGPPQSLLAPSTPNLAEEYFGDLEQRVRSSGRPWLGWISYELGSLADTAISTAPPGNGEILAEFFPVDLPRPYPYKWGFPSTGQPPIHAGLIREWSAAGLPAASGAALQSRDSYIHSVRELLDGIQRGDWYEANLTTRFHRRLDQYPEFLEETLVTALNPAYGAVVHGSGYSYLSASPELFLQRTGDRIQTCPIKGTAPRGMTPQLDQEQRQFLEQCPKNQSEHLMVVDLARNDLGRICTPGSVVVSDFGRVEVHPAVHHLVSTIEGQLRPAVSFWNILQATWPAASITGCPKVAVTRVLSRMEPGPRGVYTGSIGVLYPNGDFQLNVAIRTVALTSDSGGGTLMVMGSGGAIVADSHPEQEWQECLMKVVPLFGILETGPLRADYRQDKQPCQAPVLH
jgi:hypothetical protein